MGLIATLTAADFAIGTPIAAVLLALGFGFVIFVHELGHFLAAKAVGIKCSQFAIGFGRAILCYRKGIGLRLGGTEPQFIHRINEHLARRGIEPRPHGEQTEITEEVVTRETHKTTRYANEQIDRAAAELGLGETEYRLNWLPLGGYVKMLGQEDTVDQSGVPSDDPRSFNRKPIWARFLVISAGVVVNAVFAVVFFVAAFMYGIEFPAAVIGPVAPGSPAATTAAMGHSQVIGLREGDRVLAVNGQPPVDFMDISIASALTGRGEKVAIDVDRPAGYGLQGGRYTFKIEPLDRIGQLRAIGVMPPLDLKLLQVNRENQGWWDQQYGKMGLRPGMMLAAINGQPVEGRYELDRAAEASKGQPLSLTFEDEQGQANITQTPQTGLAGGEPEGEDAGPAHLLGLVPPLKVAAVVPGRPAEGLLREADIVLKINTVELPSWEQAMDLIPRSRGAVEFTVMRDGERRTVAVAPRKGKIGVRFDYAVDSNYVARVLSGSPFASLQLIVPARIQAVDGKPVGNYTELRNALARGAGKASVTYTLAIGEKPSRPETRTIELGQKNTRALAALPWRLDLPPFQDLRTVQKATTVAQAVRMGFHKSWVMMIQTYQTLKALLTRTVPAEELRGPVGIAHAGTILAKRGWTYLMFFLGVISVNLAVLNFLPVPILDGGLAVLLLAEKVRGRPVPPQVHSALNMIGAALLLSLVLFATYNDIWRLING